MKECANDFPGVPPSLKPRLKRMLLVNRENKSLVFDSYNQQAPVFKGLKTQLLSRGPCNYLHIAILWDQEKDCASKLSFDSGSPMHFDEEVGFINALLQHLEFLQSQSLALQILVRDATILDLITRILLRQSLAKNNAAKKLLLVLNHPSSFYYQDVKDVLQGCDPTSLVQDAKFVCFAPPTVVPLCSLMTALYVVPCIGFVSFSDVLGAFGCPLSSSVEDQLTACKKLLGLLHQDVPPSHRLGETAPFKFWKETRFNHDPMLQRLFYVKKRELQTELLQLRQDRLSNSPALRVKVHLRGVAEVLEGLEFLSTDEKTSLGSYLIHKAEDDSGLLNFVDLSYAESIHFQIKNQKNPWLGDILDSSIEEDKAYVQLPHWLAQGEYIIRPRCMDFLFSKVASALESLKNEQCRPLTRFFKTKPIAIKWKTKKVCPALESLQTQDMKQKLNEAQLTNAKPLFLSPSQFKAFDATRKFPLQLLWGPPGTGKTTYLASLMIRWVQYYISTQQDFHIIVTAFTKNAIFGLMETFKAHYTAWKAVNLGPQWPEFTKMCFYVYRTADDSPEELGLGSCCTKNKLPTGKHLIFCGTIHQLARLQDWKTNLLIIDEGSQMLLVDALIPLSLLHVTGRLIVAGDHLQLSPILKAEYAPPPPDELNVSASILTALIQQNTVDPTVDILRVTPEQCPVMIQLQENWRSSPEICQFTQRLYGQGYHVPEERKDQDRLAIAQIPQNAILGPIFFSHQDKNSYPYGLVTIEICTSLTLAPETERLIEASLLRKLLTELRTACPASKCFVPTPHRSQKYWITQICNEDPILSDAKVTNQRTNKEEKAFEVDTVERMQGRQADCVIFSAMLTNPDVIAREVAFLYSLQRLNVAMSRAQKLCIVVGSTQLFSPTAEVLSHSQTREGYQHLSAFKKASKLVFQIKILNLECAEVLMNDKPYLTLNKQAHVWNARPTETNTTVPSAVPVPVLRVCPNCHTKSSGEHPSCTECGVKFGN
jgi:hypothetical protein